MPWNTENRTCGGKTCPPSTPYCSDWRCVSRCFYPNVFPPTLYLNNTNCISPEDCKKAKLFRHIGRCVASCPPGTVIRDNYNDTCYDLAGFKQNVAVSFPLLLFFLTVCVLMLFNPKRKTRKKTSKTHSGDEEALISGSTEDIHPVIPNDPPVQRRDEALLSEENRSTTESCPTVLSEWSTGRPTSHDGYSFDYFCDSRASSGRTADDLDLYEGLWDKTIACARDETRVKSVDEDASDDKDPPPDISKPGEMLGYQQLASEGIFARLGITQHIADDSISEETQVKLLPHGDSINEETQVKLLPHGDSISEETQVKLLPHGDSDDDALLP